MMILIVSHSATRIFFGVTAVALGLMTCVADAQAQTPDRIVRNEAEVSAGEQMRNRDVVADSNVGEPLVIRSSSTDNDLSEILDHYFQGDDAQVMGVIDGLIAQSEDPDSPSNEAEPDERQSEQGNSVESASEVSAGEQTRNRDVVADSNVEEPLDIRSNGTDEDLTEFSRRAEDLGEVSRSHDFEGEYAPLMGVIDNLIAQSEDPDSPSGAGELEQDDLDEGTSETGYPQDSDEIDDPTDNDAILRESFAQPGAVFQDLVLPGRNAYEQFKRDTYERYGLRFGLSYQQLVQWASDTLPTAEYDTAIGGWASFQLEWVPLDRGGDYEGRFVFQAGWRDTIGDSVVPAQFGLPQLGSAVANYEFTTWEGVRIEDLYWEQQFGGNRFSLRVGNFTPQAIFNFSRFKNARVSYTASPFTFHETIPYPTYGLGVSFRLRPIENSEFYLVGTLNDMNGDPADRGLDWSTIDNGQFFYGLEAGYFWRRDNGEFDHLHLSAFYADERSTRSPDLLPNEAGGGFRIYGERQFGRFVVLGGYTFNTAEGGGISATYTRQAITAGLAYLNPLNIRGEAAMGLIYSQPIEDVFPGSGQRDQYTIDTYWRIQMTPNLTVTPALWFIFDPSFNPTVDVQVVPQIKFQLLL